MTGLDDIGGQRVTTVLATFAEPGFTNLRPRVCFYKAALRQVKDACERPLLEPRVHFLPHIKGNEMCRALIKHERLRCKPESRVLNGIWRSQLVGGVSIIWQQ